MAEEAIYSASWLINPDAPPVSGGALFVRNGIIADVAPLEQLRRRYAVPVHDYPGCVLLPGFVNAHTHLELSHFPSWLIHSGLEYSPRRFTDWLIQLIKVLRSVGADAYPASILEGIRMCLESGTTVVGEIVTTARHAALYRTSPLAGRLYFELLGQDEAFFTGKLAAALEAVAAGEEGAIACGLSPHAPYTIARRFLAGAAEAANREGLPLAIHCAESAAELELLGNGSGDFADSFYPFVGWQNQIAEPAGCHPVELLARHGLLTSKTMLIHAVQVTEKEALLIKESGAHVVLCPRSNDILDVGCAPAGLYKKLGIPLALGTDSLASNNSLSLWDELRFAREVYRGELTGDDLLHMATSGGAAALGMADRCGVIAAGRRADFQLLEMPLSATPPNVEQLIDEARVRDVIVAGQRYVGRDSRAAG